MRYLPLTPDDRAQMLARIGVANVDELFADIPEAARVEGLLNLPTHQSEMAVERHLTKLAGANRAASEGPFFVGAGAYKHHVPSTVDHLIQRSEFLTSYTPYQPEITQGTLQSLFEFQTQVARLTGMEVANASMYDGSTATAEAVLMAQRVTKRSHSVLAGGLHPHYRDVVKTQIEMSGGSLDIRAVDPSGTASAIEAITDKTACIVVQSPNVFGEPVDLRPIAEAAHAQGALLVAVFTEVVSLGLMESPGSQGADIVVGEGQSIGNALNFGGPYVGLFAARQKYIRQMPGRLCGETVDADGRRGFVLTLSTREQHIRRDKATSNICTNSGLCCLAFTIHMTLLGGEGFQKLAQLNHEAACDLADRLEAIDGVEMINTGFFNEFTIRLPRNATEVVDQLAERGILAGVPYSRLDPSAGLDDLLIVAATETTTDEDRSTYAAALKEVLA